MTEAPAMRQPWITLMPTPPQPITAQVEPGVTLAVLMAAPTPVVTPQPISEAISNGTSSSILMAPSCGTTSDSANVPKPAMPNRSVSPSLKRGMPATANWIITHRCGDFWSTQAMHFPHGGDQATITWSPTATPVTSLPDLGDDARTLVAGHERHALGEAAVHGVHVGVAHAGGLDLDPHVGRPRAGADSMPSTISRSSSPVFRRTAARMISPWSRTCSTRSGGPAASRGRRPD